MVEAMVFMMGQSTGGSAKMAGGTSVTRGRYGAGRGGDGGSGGRTGSGARFVVSAEGEVLDVSKIVMPKGKAGYLTTWRPISDKSGTFKKKLGFEEGEALESALEAHLMNNFGTSSGLRPMKDGVGSFSVTGPVSGPSGATVQIQSVWGVRNDGSISFITAYEL